MWRSARRADMLTLANLDTRRAFVVCGAIAFMEISLRVFRNRTNVNTRHLAFTQRSNPSLCRPDPTQTGFRKDFFSLPSSSNLVWAGRKLSAALIILSHLNIIVCTETDTVLYNDQVAPYSLFKINLYDLWVEKWSGAKYLWCERRCLCVLLSLITLSRVSFFTCSWQDKWHFLLSSLQTLASVFIIPLLFTWSQTRALFYLGGGTQHNVQDEMNHSPHPVLFNPHPFTQLMIMMTDILISQLWEYEHTRGFRRSKEKYWGWVFVRCISSGLWQRYEQPRPNKLPSGPFPFFIHLLNRGNNSTFTVMTHRRARLQSLAIPPCTKV